MDRLVFSGELWQLDWLFWYYGVLTLAVAYGYKIFPESRTPHGCFREKKQVRDCTGAAVAGTESDNQGLPLTAPLGAVLLLPVHASTHSTCDERRQLHARKRSDA